MEQVSQSAMAQNEQEPKSFPFLRFLSLLLLVGVMTCIANLPENVFELVQVFGFSLNKSTLIEAIGLTLSVTNLPIRIFLMVRLGATQDRWGLLFFCIIAIAIFTIMLLPY